MINCHKVRECNRARSELLQKISVFQAIHKDKTLRNGYFRLQNIQHSMQFL